MKQKTLTVELTPEERDILHSALLNHRLFIERQMDDEKMHSDFIEFYFYKLQLVEIKALAKKLKLESVKMMLGILVACCFAAVFIAFLDSDDDSGLF